VRPAPGRPATYPSEQERRDLEVEDRCLGVADRGTDALVHGAVREVARDVGKARREAVEHLRVDRLAGSLDRVARTLHELVDRPVVDRDADDRAVEEPPLLELVQRVEGHDLREVSRDAEDDQDVGRRCRRGAHNLALPPAPITRPLRR
jgi:hypothetical protein